MEKNIGTNRKAYHDYYIQDTCEAGMSLLGTEVKSLREGRVYLKDSYVIIKNNEAFLLNCHLVALLIVSELLASSARRPIRHVFQHISVHSPFFV